MFFYVSSAGHSKQAFRFPRSKVRHTSINSGVDICELVVGLQPYGKLLALVWRGYKRGARGGTQPEKTPPKIIVALTPRLSPGRRGGWSNGAHTLSMQTHGLCPLALALRPRGWELGTFGHARRGRRGLTCEQKPRFRSPTPARTPHTDTLTMTGSRATRSTRHTTKTLSTAEHTQHTQHTQHTSKKSAHSSRCIRPGV